MVEKEILPQIRHLLKERKFDQIKSILNSLHPEDVASILDKIERPALMLVLFRFLEPQKSIEVFEYLPHETQEKIIKSMPSEEVKKILDEMSPDERTALFEDMPAELVKKLLFLLSPQERQTAIELLNFPEDSVGRLITPDFVQLQENWTVKEALEHIRRVGLEKETVYHCYVLDKDKRLIGLVSLKNLVLASPTTKIKEIMNRDVIKVDAYTDKEEAAKIFKDYDLIALPVVDKENKLLGIITFDDFVDVLEEEATEDFEKFGAVLPVDKPYMEAGFFEITWKRTFWLIVLLVLESFSGIVMQNYSSTISKMIALTFFVPILVATGGNAGTQSATLVIRGLATGELDSRDFFKIIFRESSMGFLIGLVLGFMGLLRAFMQSKIWTISVAVGLGMCVTIVMATTIGATLPLVFRRLRLDPALMSSPLIATIVDIVGIGIYFQIATFTLNFLGR